VAVANHFEAHQRIDDPVAERARADRGQRLVEDGEQRAAPRAIGRGDQFEMPPRDLIDHHVLGRAISARRSDVREVAAEGLLDIGKRGARRDSDGTVELK